jgi:predicted ABC-type ATPase
MAVLYIISGCNGAGKTTASKTILPEILNCREFVNADEIARGLSPYNPEGVAFKAGRIMLERLDELLAEKVDFAFETTLATRSYVSFVKQAQENGYTVVLLYLWLKDAELAKNRVKTRVEKGGHNIPEEVVERRYRLGLQNLFNLYLPIVDEWLLYDNSNSEKKQIAYGDVGGETNIVDESIFNKMKSHV